MMGIYRIRNSVNGDFYVGSSVDIRKRFNTHKKLLRKGSHHSLILQRAWLKYGENIFVFEIVQAVEAAEQLIEAEQKLLDANPKYNVRKTAGSFYGMRHSPETRKKMSIRAMGNKNANGPKSSEHKMKIGAAHRGMKHSAEFRKKLSEIAKRRPSPSAETRRKMSESQKKRDPSSRRGITPSEHVRKKISNANLGQKRSPETCALLSRLANERWARIKGKI